MPKDEIIRVRCTAAQKERLNAVAGRGKLSEFVLEAALYRAAEAEHSSATRDPKVRGGEAFPSVPVRLSDGTMLGGKRTFKPDPK